MLTLASPCNPALAILVEKGRLPVVWSKIFGSKKGEKEGEKSAPEEGSPNTAEEAPPRRRMPKISTTEIRPVKDEKADSDPISLKAKVSTWESFFSLFSGDKSELSLYIPTQKQTRVRENIAILLFTPTGDAVPLDGSVVHIFYDSSGKQIGVGVKLVNVGSKKQRFQELMNEAARHVNVPSQGPLDIDDDEGIPIFVEDETPLSTSKIGTVPKDAVPPPGRRHITSPQQPVKLREPDPAPMEPMTRPVQPSGELEGFLGDLADAFADEPGDLEDTGGLFADEEKTGVYGRETQPVPEEQDGLNTEIVMRPPGMESDEEVIEVEIKAAEPPSPEPVPGSPQPDQMDSNTLVGLGPEEREGRLTPGGTSPLMPQASQPHEPLVNIPTEAQVRAPSPSAFLHQQQPENQPIQPVVTGPQVFSRSTFVPVVGMDFGTTRSSVAVVVNDEIKVLQSKSGLYNIPSVVGFTAGGEAVVGTEARELLIIDPAHAIASPKRLLGRQFSDRELEPFLAGLAINYSEAPNGQVLLHPRGKTYTMPQVCAPILFSLRMMAQEFLQQDVRQVVLTSPVSFDEGRMQALEDAASLAGLELMETVDEPTAAALAHHFDEDFEEVVAVFDFGGGTFDFSLVDVSSDDLAVVATAGDTWLGGDDFDLALANAAANAFWRRHQIEIRHQVVRWQRLLIAAEKAKRELSIRDDTILALPDAALTSRGPLALRCPVGEAQFRQLVEELIERSLDTCREAMDLAEIEPSAVNAVYMSGGTSCIPAVREAVAAYFDKTPKSTIAPERAVVMGAALVGAQIWENKVAEGD